MKNKIFRSRMSRSLITLAALLILLSSYPVCGEEKSGKISIDEVEVDLENRTGMLYFRFQARGSAPAGTDHVNVTFGYSNSTDRVVLDVWIEEMDAMLFGNGISLLPSGPEEDPWSSYVFTAALFLPYMGNISSTIDILMGIIGELAGNISGNGDAVDEQMDPYLGNMTDTSDLLEQMDPIEVLAMLRDTKLLFIARAVDQEGSYTEAERDVKMELLDAVFGFLGDEGIIEPFDGGQGSGISETDSETGNEKESRTSIVPLMLLTAGITLLLVSIVSVIVLLISRKGRK